MSVVSQDKAAGVPKYGSAKLNAMARSARPSRPGMRVNEAMMSNERSEEVLNKLRDLLIGPTQKLADARYSEMVDILEEQDLSQQQNFGVLSSQIAELTAGIGKLKTALSELQDLYQRANTRHDQQLAELREHVERALHAHADARRDLEHLSNTVEEHKAATETGLEKLKTNSQVALDQRLAQWRAERDDERVDDLKLVADSFLDIGQRLAALRASSYKVS
jgi:chromosome segregation ATPase